MHTFGLPYLWCLDLFTCKSILLLKLIQVFLKGKNMNLLVRFKDLKSRKNLTITSYQLL